MASIRELRGKIKSVKSTQQITRAMKMVAAARLTKSQNRIIAGRPFADTMEVLLNELAFLIREKQGGSITTHPFMAQKKSKRTDIVLVTADRGLCGSFNATLIRRTIQELKGDRKFHLWIVGKKGRDFFKRHHQKIEKEYVGFFQRLGFEQAEIIGGDIIDTFLNTDSQEVYVIYNEFKSRLNQELVVKKILPIESVPEIKPKNDFIYEPNQAEILNQLFPRYIKAQIYRILLESQAAELAARMNAMESATNNASDLIYSLTLTMNKLRQAVITREISEIVGGADALQAD